MPSISRAQASLSGQPYGMKSTSSRRQRCRGGASSSWFRRSLLLPTTNWLPRLSAFPWYAKPQQTTSFRSARWSCNQPSMRRGGTPGDRLPRWFCARFYRAKRVAGARRAQRYRYSRFLQRTQTLCTRRTLRRTWFRRSQQKPTSPRARHRQCCGWSRASQGLQSLDGMYRLRCYWSPRSRRVRFPTSGGAPTSSFYRRSAPSHRQPPRQVDGARPGAVCCAHLFQE